MSCTGEAVPLSIETNPSLFLGKHSMLSEALFTSPLVQTTLGKLMKIYCVARSVSTFRLALEGTTYLTAQLSNRETQMLLQNCGSHSQDRKLTDHDLHLKNMKSDSVSAENLIGYGRTRLKVFIEENTPERFQESGLLRIFKSALGLPQDKCLKNNTAVPSCISSNDRDVNCSISTALWHVAEERWKEATETLFSYTPEKMIHSAIEMAQERIRELMTNSSLVSQMLQAGDLLTSATQSIKNEAEILSQLWCERKEHTLAGVSEFLKRYHENETALETLYSLVNEHILSHVACEGVELFSQYVWMMKPDFYEQDFLEANLQHIDDEGFHFMAEVQVPRRSILYIGAR